MAIVQARPATEDVSELPRRLGDADLVALPERLVGMPIQEALVALGNVTNVDALYVPQTRTLLLEAEGEQRRASKRKHYSVEISC